MTDQIANLRQEYLERNLGNGFRILETLVMAATFDPDESIRGEAIRIIAKRYHGIVRGSLVVDNKVFVSFGESPPYKRGYICNVPTQYDGAPIEIHPFLIEERGSQN